MCFSFVNVGQMQNISNFKAGALKDQILLYDLCLNISLQFDSDLCIYVHEGAVQVDIFIFLLLYIQICP